MNAAGDVFYTDNQGPWNGTCGMKHLVPGKFMGNPTGFKWYSLAEKTLGKPPVEPKSNSRMMIEAARVPELEPTPSCSLMARWANRLRNRLRYHGRQIWAF